VRNANEVSVSSGERRSREPVSDPDEEKGGSGAAIEFQLP
jgi:hypothetical protein